MRCDQRQHAAGLQGVDRLGEEEIVQRQLLAAIVELDVGEGTLPITASMRSSGSFVSRKFSMRMSCSGCRALAIRPEMESSSTPMKRCPSPALAHEIAGAAAGLQDRGVAGTPRRAIASWMAVMTVGDV